MLSVALGILFQVHMNISQHHKYWRAEATPMNRLIYYSENILDVVA